MTRDDDMVMKEMVMKKTKKIQNGKHIESNKQNNDQCEEVEAVLEALSSTYSCILHTSVLSVLRGTT